MDVACTLVVCALSLFACAAANVEQGGGQAQDATGAVVGPHLQQQQQPGALVQPGLHGWAGELGSVENWWIDLMAEGFNGLATGTFMTDAQATCCMTQHTEV